MTFDLEQLRLNVRRRGLGSEEFRGIHEIAEMCRLNFPVNEIKAKIEPFPMLSAMMVRSASSAEHGIGRISSLLYALEVLGYRGIKQVCLSELFRPVAQEVNLLKFANPNLISSHCLAMGVFARALAGPYKDIDPDVAFTAGLFCDVGYLVWARFMPNMMDRIAATAIHTEYDNLLALERGALGYDHAEAGAVIAEELHLSEEIIHAIGSHHSPSESDAEGRRLADLCHLASFALDRLDRPAIAGSKSGHFDSEVLVRLEIELENLEELVQSATSEFTELSTAA